MFHMKPTSHPLLRISHFTKVIYAESPNLRSSLNRTIQKKTNAAESRTVNWKTSCSQQTESGWLLKVQPTTAFQFGSPRVSIPRVNLTHVHLSYCTFSSLAHSFELDSVPHTTRLEILQKSEEKTQQPIRSSTTITIILTTNTHAVVSEPEEVQVPSPTT